MPWSRPAWIAAMDSLSSCAPQANSHLPPPIAQAPIPIGVILKSLCPSVRNVIFKSPQFIKCPAYYTTGLLSRRRHFRFSQLFHPPDDGGKVFLIPGRGFFRIDCCGRFGRGHRKSKLCRRIQDQSEILAHETNRKLWRVVVLFGGNQFAGMGRSDDSSLGQCVKEKIARQVQPRAQRDRFSGGLHAYS